jgi:hypothetical protein
MCECFTRLDVSDPRREIEYDPQGAMEYCLITAFPGCGFLSGGYFREVNSLDGRVIISSAGFERVEVGPDPKLHASVFHGVAGDD